MCVCVSDSKKLEMELQALKDNNARLMDTLQEADSNAESWKSKVTQSQDENNQLRNKVKPSGEAATLIRFALAEFDHRCYRIRICSLGDV